MHQVESATAIARAHSVMQVHREQNSQRTNLKSSWGGGAPVSVTVYFTKESAIAPNKAITAQLVEESDEGFYIVGPKETRAIFIPRSSVALVYFSDKVAESPLLREGK